jgi:hypothetical protein
MEYIGSQRVNRQGDRSQRVNSQGDLQGFGWVQVRVRIRARVRVRARVRIQFGRLDKFDLPKFNHAFIRWIHCAIKVGPAIYFIEEGQPMQARQGRCQNTGKDQTPRGLKA